jgi:hypothetical protein
VADPVVGQVVFPSVDQHGLVGSPAPTHSLSPVTRPTAGLPSGPVAGAPIHAAPATPGPEDATELPIFREMEAVWFRSHGQDSTQIFTLPTAGQAQSPVTTASGSTRVQARVPLPARTPGGSAPPPYPGAAAAVPPAPAAATAAPTVPQPRGAADSAWRTAADEGWARADQAAQPTDGGTTRSGLPKRVPQAQLVPGGVEARSGQKRVRRTPDEVRGMLSAYHRGVQRGRSDGSEPNGTTSTKETSG